MVVRLALPRQFKLVLCVLISPVIGENWNIQHRFPWFESRTSGMAFYPFQPYHTPSEVWYRFFALELIWVLAVFLMSYGFSDMQSWYMHENLACIAYVKRTYCLVNKWQERYITFSVFKTAAMGCFRNGHSLKKWGILDLKIQRNIF